MCPPSGVDVTDTAVVARQLSRVYRVQKKAPGLLGSLRGLVRRVYSDVRAVDAVSFTIQRGEMVGFLGPNGAGKTTTLKMLAGLIQPTDGEARVLGYEPFRRERAFQRRFAIVLGQKNQLWWDLPAGESFLLNKEIYGIPSRQYAQTLGELSELLELGPLLDVQVRKLSLGERMKCELAAALLHRPDVLFLDEPTIGLDVVMQQKIREFVAVYRQRHRATILLTSHYMDDVKALCERVIVIDRGRLIYDGGLSELTRRYADDKLLILELESPAEREAFAALGEVIAWEPTKVSLRVPRAEVSARAARLLAAFPVLDLAIQEPEVEDVIRDLFSGHLRAEVAGFDQPVGDAPSDAVPEALNSLTDAGETVAVDGLARNGASAELGLESDVDDTARAEDVP
ncbi:MAG: ATP-binding cassette domain-containing protein [Chloroflexi bacterium]|nr:ATP-binding cassette domain-containing protein [Chloroflexota bacterium]